MKPVLFGPPSRRLFGIHHAAQRSGSSAVLVCMPFGQEAIRTHRFFRVLSDRLARAGHVVLRFDFFGSGDSGGADADGELDGWTRDVGLAHEELRRHAGDRRITWVGARLGGTVAAKADASHPRAARLLLWDPVLEGSRYLESLRTAHVTAMEQSYFEPDRRWRRWLTRRPESFTDEALGTAISPVLLAQLRAMQPETVAPPQTETTVLASPDDRAAQRWVDNASASGAPIRLSTFRHPLNWTLTPDADNPVVPGDAIQRMLAEING